MITIPVLSQSIITTTTTLLPTPVTTSDTFHAGLLSNFTSSTPPVHLASNSLTGNPLFQTGILKKAANTIGLFSEKRAASLLEGGALLCLTGCENGSDYGEAMTIGLAVGVSILFFFLLYHLVGRLMWRGVFPVRSEEAIEAAMERAMETTPAIKENEAIKYIQNRLRLIIKWEVGIIDKDRIAKSIKILEIMVKTAPSKEKGVEWKIATVWFSFYLKGLRLSFEKRFIDEDAILVSLLNDFDSLLLVLGDQMAAYDIARVVDKWDPDQRTEQNQLDFLESLSPRKLKSLKLRRRPV